MNVNIDGDGNASVYRSTSRSASVDASVLGSLSERYPAPLSPPVLLSPPSPHTALSSPDGDVLSLGSSSSRSGSPFDVVSPLTHFGGLHFSSPPLHTFHSTATSEDEFMSFGDASDWGGVMSAPRSTRPPIPFSDFEEGSEFESGSDTSESGSEGSWGQVDHGTGRR